MIRRHAIRYILAVLAILPITGCLNASPSSRSRNIAYAEPAANLTTRVDYDVSTNYNTAKADEELDCSLSFIDVANFMREMGDRNGSSQFLKEAEHAVSAAYIIHYKLGVSLDKAIQRVNSELDAKSRIKSPVTYDDPADSTLVMSCMEKEKRIFRSATFIYFRRIYKS